MVSLRVFGLQRDGMVELDGRWALLPDRGELALVQQPVSLQRWSTGERRGTGVSPGTGVDAMSELIADLSRQIAEAIRALPPEQTPVEIEEETVTSEEIEDAASEDGGSDDLEAWATARSSTGSSSCFSSWSSPRPSST